MNDGAFKDHVARLKSAVRGTDIAADLGLRGKGRRFFCPSCQSDGARHKSPDFGVTDKGFKCFKCGISGDIIDLVVLAGGMNKADAIRYLQTRAGMAAPPKVGRDMGRRPIARPGASWGHVSSTTPDKTPPTAKMDELRAAVAAIHDGTGHSGLYEAFLSEVCRPIAGTPGAAYLEGRGIDADIADRYGVRYCPDLAGLWTLAERKDIKAAGLTSLYVFQKADLPFLVFPYRRRGKPVFIKSRSMLSKDEADGREVPRFLNTGGTVPCLWNHDAIEGADRVIITEGEIDALSWIVMGRAAVGLPGWSHWKDAWIADFAGKEVFLDLDADAAGQKGAADIAKRFQKAGQPCPKTLARPKGQKDANELLQAMLKDGKTEKRKEGNHDPGGHQ